MRISVYILFCFVLAACTSRGMTKPRSQLLEEAKSKGIQMSSIEEDRQRFFQNEENQKKRVLEVVSSRTNQDTRDVNYHIGPQDELEINVFDVPELNLTSRVGQSGFLSLPLIGAVKAGGVTEQQLKEDLQKRLSAFVKNPQVSVFVSHYGSQKVAVLGAVNKPGSYSLKKGDNSILELIGEAGGLSNSAGNIINFIPAEFSGIGGANDAEARARLSLQAAEQKPDAAKTSLELYIDQVMGTDGGIPLEMPVRGGDMIVVPAGGKVMVQGEVDKPGSYELGQQMSVLGSLAAAGGITYGAKFDEIEVVREFGPNEKIHLVCNLEKMAQGEEKDIRLRNGDVVLIPSDSGRRMSQDTFEGFTKLINFGIGGSVGLN